MTIVEDSFARVSAETECNHNDDRTLLWNVAVFSFTHKDWQPEMQPTSKPEPNTLK